MDAALDWQHANVRGGAARLVFHTVLTANMGGPFPSDRLLAKQALNTLTAALQVGAPLQTVSKRSVLQ